MQDIIDNLKKDIIEFTNKCGKLSIHSTEYHYWNGCRCQAEVTLKQLEAIVPDKATDKVQGIKLLNELIHSNNIRKVDIYKATGIDQSKLSRICNGSLGISPSIAIKLGNYFNVPASSFTHRTIIKPKSTIVEPTDVVGRIKKAMEDTYINTNLLAEKTDISRATISAVLNGHRKPTRKFLISVGKVLDLCLVK